MRVAQAINLPGSNGTPIKGPLPTIEGGGFKFENIGDIVSSLLNIIFPVAGLILFIMLIWGGFEYLTSAGEAAQAEKAQKRMTAALIGFVFVFVAYWLTQLLTFIFGFEMF